MTLALALEKAGGVDSAVDAVIEAGRQAAGRHWVPATSGNFSVRIDQSRIAITSSGVDKGALTRSDVLIQDLGRKLQPGSSAEAELHVRRYSDDPGIGAIFHIHGPCSTVIGQAHARARSVKLKGWELQKALAGVKTHATTVEVPVFANDQHVARLSDRVADRFAEPVPPGAHRAPGYLLAGHGLYAWGRTAKEAARHLEALETLFNYVLMQRTCKP